MRSPTIRPAGVLLLCLTACAQQPSLPPEPPPIPASLRQPCPPWHHPALPTNQALLDAYLDSLRWGEDCRQRHLETVSR